MDFIVLVDALRHDYVTEKDMPFLYSLKARSRFANVIETFAFQTRPAFFAGLEPDQSGICYLFEHNPQFSPFSWLKPFSPVLRRFDQWGTRPLGRGVIRRIAKRIEKRRGFDASSDVMSCSRIPLHLLPYFALAERTYTDSPNVFSPHSTLFDLLRAHNKSWSWTGYPRHFGSTRNILKSFSSTAESDVAYLHFSELDWIGHKFGPDSEQRRTACLELDGEISQLLAKYSTTDSRIVVFGDHGMVTVDHTIDLIGGLSSLEARLGNDYLVFVDSTQARFWFFNEDAKKAVIDFLRGLSGVDILSDTERSELGVQQHRDKFGELIIAVTGNGIFHPSFFSREPHPPIGMHGYRPSVHDNQTQIFLYPESSTDLGTIKMTEMFGLMALHLGVR